MEVVIQIPQEAIIEGIKQAFAPYMPKVGKAIAAALPALEQEWVTAPVAKKMLKEKGYRATAYQTLIALAKTTTCVWRNVAGTYREDTIRASGTGAGIYRQYKE